MVHYADALTQAQADSYCRNGLQFPIPVLTPNELPGLPCQECLRPLSLWVGVVENGPLGC